MTSEPDAENASTRDVSLWFGRALGFGVVVGWLDLAVVMAWRRADLTITMAMLRTNRHASWMIPLGDLLLFTTLGLVLAAFARFRPGLARRTGWRAYTGLAVLALVANVPGLHRMACLALAIGVGVRLGPRVGRIAESRPTLMKRLASGLLAGLVVFAVATVWHVSSSERRALAALPRSRANAPNVLFVVLDNVRASSLSLYGRDRATTPRLERLAREAVVFDQARSASSWTLASHASMFTGRWCHELSFDYDRPLKATHPTVAGAFAAEGYATAGFVGNTYYCNSQYGLNRDFAHYEDHYENGALSLFEVLRSSNLGKWTLTTLGYGLRVDQGASVRKTAEMLNRDALAWIDGKPKDRPFFAFINYFDAHSPFIPPDNSAPRFGLAALSVDERSKLIEREIDLASGKPLPPETVETIRRDAKAARLDSYESCIAYLDLQLGKLFAELDRRGLRDDTVILVTSDHGEHFAERGYYGHGQSLYEPEVHVPLLIFHPQSVTAGRRVADAVSLRDTASTVIDLAGLIRQDRLPGQSLGRFWRPGPSRQPTIPLSELARRKNTTPNPALPTSLGPLTAILEEGKVYIRNGVGGEELYDLGPDPEERDNLINRPDFQTSASRSRQFVDRLPERARAIGRPTESMAGKIEPPETRRR